MRNDDFLAIAVRKWLLLTFIYKGQLCQKRKRVIAMDREKVISALNRALDDEMNKPAAKWDIEKIDELTAAINEIRGNEAEKEPSQEFTDAVISGSENRIAAKKRSAIKRFTAAAACLAVAFVGADLTSRQALGQGVLPAGYQAVMGGIHTFLDGGDGTPDPHENIYYDIMKEKIDQYGLDVMIPTYIPKGFELEQTYENNMMVVFYFVNGRKRVNISYHIINDLNKIGSFGIPTDTREVYEKEVSGHIFNTIKEDDQLKAWCIEQNSITQLNTYDVSYIMADEILYSFEALK